MPRFNSRGDYCAGVGGDNVVLSVNGAQIFRAPSSAIGWITDNEIMSVTWTGEHDIRAIAIDMAGNERLLYKGGISGAACGGGRWAVRPLGQPWLFDDNSRTELGVEHFGADGTVVTWTWGGGGLALNGATLVEHAYCYTIQVLAHNTALWQQHGAPEQIKTIGMPTPLLLPGIPQHFRAVFHNGTWWGIYHPTGLGRLVLHPFDSFQGYVLTEPWNRHNPETWAYRPDIASIGGKLRAVWAAIESEMPNEIRYREQASFPPLVDLRTLLAPPTPEPDKPQPPRPEPKPEEPTMDIAKYLVDRIDVVESVKEDYPHLSGGEIVDQVAHRLNREHGLSGSQIVFGRKARQSDGGNPNEDILAIRRSMTDVAQKAMVDILRDGGGEDEPRWSVIPQHEEAGNGFWRSPVMGDLDKAPTEPSQPAPEEPKPAPTPTPSEPSNGSDDDLLAFLDLMIEEQILTNEKLAEISQNSAVMVEHLAAIRGDLKNFSQDFKAMLPEILKVLGAGGLGGFGGLFKK